MVPYTSPEGAPHGVVVAELVLPGIGLEAAEFENHPAEKARRQILGNLRLEDIHQNPVLQIPVDLIFREERRVKAKILNANGIEDIEGRHHPELFNNRGKPDPIDFFTIGLHEEAPVEQLPEYYSFGGKMIHSVLQEI